MIQVLNKKSEQVRANTMVYTPHIRFSNDRSIMFNAGAMQLCNMQAGKYVHFIILNERTWCFKINNDPSGFKICPTTKKGSNVRVSAQGIIRIFREKTSHPLPSSFYIQHNKGATHDGEDIFEILTHKPIEEFRKVKV